MHFLKTLLTGIIWMSFVGLLVAEEESMEFSLRSNFENMGEISSKYTCEGEDVSPPLVWSNPPKGTESFALIVDDPDAPDPKAPRMIFVHWILYNIPKDIRELKEGVDPSELPSGTLEGISDYKKTSYGGPCPPIGRHRYFFKLYALSKRLPDLRHPIKKELEKAMEGSILGSTELIGTYQKEG